MSRSTCRYLGRCFRYYLDLPACLNISTVPSYTCTLSPPHAASSSSYSVLFSGPRTLKTDTRHQLPLVPAYFHLDIAIIRPASSYRVASTPDPQSTTFGFVPSRRFRTLPPPTFLFARDSRTWGDLERDRASLAQRAAWTCLDSLATAVPPYIMLTIDFRKFS